MLESLGRMNPLSNFSRRTAVNALLIGSVWALWLFGLGPTAAIGAALNEWPVALTMVFGSFVAGATSVGGGAVAFPVLTKALDVSPESAKLFSLAIQSVGMTSASITIVLLRVPVHWRIVLACSLTGALGMLFGLLLLSPYAQSEETKVAFTAMQAAFAAVLLITRERRINCDSNLVALQAQCPEPTNEMATSALRKSDWLILAAAGFTGGIASSLVGSGIDLIVFSVMVLLLRSNEKFATPTSVVLMAVNSLVGVACYPVLVGTIPGDVGDMWLAAVPVVVLGAPLGAYVCAQLKANTICNALLGLIFLEVLSTVLIIPLTSSTLVVAGAGLLLSSSIFWTLHRSHKS